VIPALSSALQGIETATRRLNRSAERIAGNGPGDDLAANLVDLKVSQREVQVNLASARTADETIGTLLDLVG
jgi:hypothetical protein